ncbi:MAG: hypothetical protein JXR51_01655 [Bacteroidales bacterium]|nr:hypothetical protein [Bacteroidales bacterium]
MLLNFQGNNENNSFIGFETVQAEKDGISFCVHGGTKCCYPISVGFACGEGPWLDCRGTWIM